MFILLVPMASRDEPSAKRAKQSEAVSEEAVGSNEESDFEAAEFNEEIQEAVEELNDMQAQLVQIDENCHEEIIQVETKFNEARVPVWAKRQKIIEKIPQFWATALANFEAFPEAHTERDLTVFNAISGLDVTWRDIRSDFSISFKFSSNDVLQNTMVTKQFTATPEGWDGVISTPLVFKKGQDKKSEDDSFINWLADSTEDCIESAVALKDIMWPDPLKFFLGEQEDLEGEEEDLEEGQIFAEDGGEDGEPGELYESDEEENES